MESEPENYLPDNCRLGVLTAADGMRLRTGIFPAKDAAKASILLVGGHREFMEKYCEFIEDIQKRGFDVYSYDHRGQGGSGRALENRKKSHNPDFGAIVEDMDEIVRRLIKPERLEHPLYLIAHSMGAQFALRYLHDYPGVFERAVLLAPFTNFNTARPIFTMLTKAIAWLANLLGFSEFFAPGQAQHENMIDHEHAFLLLTHDRARYVWSQDALEAKPELFIGGVTFGWLKGVTQSMNLIQSSGYVDQIETPVLALLAEQEYVVDNDMTNRLLAQMPNARFELISGTRHEMYREEDRIRDGVLDKIFSFLI